MEGTRHLKLVKGTIATRAQQKGTPEGEGRLQTPPAGSGSAGSNAATAAAEKIEPERTIRRSRVICLFFRQAGDWTVPLKEIAEACTRFTPKVAIREGEAIFLDIGICRSLHKSEGNLVLRILMLCKRFRFTPKISVADDVPTALAMARFGCEQASDLPLEALTDYANPFTPLALDDPRRKGLEFVYRALRQLGVKTLEDFANLPPGSLVTRFGQEGQLLSRQIRDALTLPWPVFRPEEKISARLDLRSVDTLSACGDLEVLMRHLEELADQSAARLRGRGQRAAAVEVEFELEKNAYLVQRAMHGNENFRRKWVVWLPVPQSTARGILPILWERIRFELDRRPLPSLVAAIGFTVLETVRGRNRQGDFFQQRSAEEIEAWEALVARLCDKLGQHRAFTAEAVERFLPERAWRRVLESAFQPEVFEKFSKNDELPERPTRVLRSPRALQRAGELLVCPYDGRSWKVMDWKGPERIAGEWWFDSDHRGVAREYFRVVTEEEDRLWVYRERNGNIYLHGYFD